MLVWPYRGAQYKINTNATATTEPTYKRNAGEKKQINQSGDEVGITDDKHLATKKKEKMCSIPGCVANSQISSTESIDSSCGA